MPGEMLCAPWPYLTSARRRRADEYFRPSHRLRWIHAHATRDSLRWIGIGVQKREPRFAPRHGTVRARAPSACGKEVARRNHAPIRAHRGGHMLGTCPLVPARVQRSSCSLHVCRGEQVELLARHCRGASTQDGRRKRSTQVRSHTARHCAHSGASRVLQSAGPANVHDAANERADASAAGEADQGSAQHYCSGLRATIRN
jgi:hypothetical protein